MRSYLEFYGPYVEFTRGIEPGKEGFVECRCPFTDNHLHGDKKPSAGVDPETGVFNCLKCGSLSPARFLVKRIPELSFVQATAIVDEYRKSNGFVEKFDTFVKVRSFNPKWEKIYDLATPDLKNIPMALDYCEGRGIAIETLIEFGVRFLDGKHTHWKRNSLVFPYFVDGRIVGLRYRDEHGSKGGEEGCHFTLWGIDDLDEGASRDITTAVLTEGESDRLRTQQELNNAGFPCVVVSTPTGAFTSEWAREFDGYTKVVAIPKQMTPPYE